MYCENCGKEFSEGSICPKCGTDSDNSVTDGKKKSKKILIVVAVLVVVIIVLGIVGFFMNKAKEKNDKSEKYNDNMEAAYCMFSDSADLLDTIADATYKGWYDAIYEDDVDINLGILFAQASVSDEISKVNRIDEALSDLYKEIKSDENRTNDQDRFDALKECYDSFQEYYECVINVSGSFNTYSESKENIKKSYKKTVNNFENEFDDTPDFNYENMLPEEESDGSSEKSDDSSSEAI